MKRKPGIRLAINIPSTLPQRIKDDNNIFSYYLNLLKGLINRKTKLIYKAIIDLLKGGGGGYNGHFNLFIHLRRGSVEGNKRKGKGKREGKKGRRVR